MSCNRSAEVHRYHDGELAAAQRAAVESHVDQCAECKALLSDLARLSALVAAAPRAALPEPALARLRESWRSSRERGVIRVAGWLTAAAAAILIAAVVSGPSHRPESAGEPSFTGTLATLPPVETTEDDELMVMALWMADELSPGVRR
ncbi:MAG: zf-HC2 domain-containing protein [Phycisphaerae bacterium]|jgi:anti-sigma factor RsiW